MKKTIAILSTLLLTCLVPMSAQQIDFIVDYNGYIILKSAYGYPTDEVRLVGVGADDCPTNCYNGQGHEEDVPDEVTYNGKTYKVVEFGPFRDVKDASRIHCLKFGKNMRKVEIYGGFGYLRDGFKVSEENKHLKAIDGILYTADGKTLLKFYPALYFGSFTIPDSVETIAERAFLNCSLFSLNQLPKSLKEIKYGAFEYSKILPEECVIPEGVRVIEQDAFFGTKIRKLILPSTLEKIGHFGSIPKLDTIVCLAPTPPDGTVREDGKTEWYGVESFNYRNGVLLVPTKMIAERYRKHRNWGLIHNIWSMNYDLKGPTAIASVRSENNNASGVYFDLQGRRLSGKPSRGVYIEDGKKRVVK